MTFFREFILRLDSSSDMEGMFRLSTAGSSISSIMSNLQSLSRPSTTLSLPRIVMTVCIDDNLIADFGRYTYMMHTCILWQWSLCNLNTSGTNVSKWLITEVSQFHGVIRQLQCVPCLSRCLFFHGVLNKVFRFIEWCRGCKSESGLQWREFCQQFLVSVSFNPCQWWQCFLQLR